jgi:hypothetical protein
MDARAQSMASSSNNWFFSRYDKSRDIADYHPVAVPSDNEHIADLLSQLETVLMP